MKMKPNKEWFSGEFVTLLDCYNNDDPVSHCRKTLVELMKSNDLLDKVVSLYTISGLSKYKKEMYFEFIFRHLSSIVDEEKKWMLDEEAEIRDITEKVNACMFDGSCGLAIWNKPFKIEHYLYGVGYVFLLVTNADLEHKVLQQSCTVFEFASLISSVNVLLHLYSTVGYEAEYFEAATSYTKNLPSLLKGSLFESLLLVPYDVPSEEFSYCLPGGREYLEHSRMKQKHDHSNISHFYRSFNAFTLPRGIEKFQRQLGKKQILTIRGHPCTGFDIVSCIEEFHLQSKLFEELHGGYGNTSTVPYHPYYEPIKGSYEYISEVSSIIGPKGGMMHVGKCSVVFPKDALLRDTRITLTSYSGNHDKSREITPMLKCEPHGIQFQKPVTVNLSTWCSAAEADNPVDVWIETSSDGVHWIKRQSRSLQQKREKQLTFESMHFCFVRWVLDMLKLWCGIKKHKSINFIKKHENVWKCTIQNVDMEKPNAEKYALHNDSMTLNYTHTTVQMKLSSASLKFAPETRIIEDPFSLPIVSVEFIVEEKATADNIVEEFELHEIDFDVSENDDSLKNNKFFVDFETIQNIHEFYVRCKQIQDGDWERFVRLQLRLDEHCIDQAQTDHQSDMKKRRIKMLKEWRKKPDTSLHALGVLVDKFFTDLADGTRTVHDVDDDESQQPTYQVSSHRSEP